MRELSELIRGVKRLPEGISIEQDRSDPLMPTGYGFYGQFERNIPSVYERPGTWPSNINIADLPSVAGREMLPQRTGAGSIITQILRGPRPILDRLVGR